MTQITSGIPITVSASAKNSSFVLMEYTGIPTIADVMTAALLVSAQVSLSGNNHLARAYVFTP